MKIAHLAKPWISVPPTGYGGVERFMYDLAIEQSKEHDVLMYATGDSQLPKTISLHATFMEQLADKGLDRNFEAAQASDFALSCIKDGTDIIHVHSVESFLAIAPHLSKKIVFTFYTDPTDATKILSTLAEPNVIFTFVSEQHRKQYPWVKNAYVVYQGINPAQYPFSAEKKGYLAFVGSIADKKGILEAIEIAKCAKMPLKIAAKIKPQDVDFYEREVKHVITNSDHVTFLGEVNDQERNRLLMHACALLFPIKWEEPFGGVQIESMVVGTPVIAFRRGSTLEVIDDGKTGFIVDTIEQAVNAIYKLDQINPTDCRQHIVDNFSIERSSKDFDTLYRSLIQ